MRWASAGVFVGGLVYGVGVFAQAPGLVRSDAGVAAMSVTKERVVAACLAAVEAANKKSEQTGVDSCSACSEGPWRHDANDDHYVSECTSKWCAHVVRFVVSGRYYDEGWCVAVTDKWGVVTDALPVDDARVAKYLGAYPDGTIEVATFYRKVGLSSRSYRRSPQGKLSDVTPNKPSKDLATPLSYYCLNDRAKTKDKAIVSKARKTCRYRASSETTKDTCCDESGCAILFMPKRRAHLSDEERIETDVEGDLTDADTCLAWVPAHASASAWIVPLKGSHLYMSESWAGLSSLAKGNVCVSTSGGYRDNGGTTVCMDVRAPFRVTESTLDDSTGSLNALTSWLFEQAVDGDFYDLPFSQTMPQIDAVFGEGLWQRAPLLNANSVAHLRYKSRRWEHASDVSMYWRAARTKDALVFAVEVSDNKVIAWDGKKRSLASDHVELSIDKSRFGVLLKADGSVVVQRWQKNEKNVNEAIAASGRWQRTLQGYRVEWSQPLEVKGPARVPFGVYVSDSDRGSAQELLMGSTLSLFVWGDEGPVYNDFIRVWEAQFK